MSSPCGHDADELTYRRQKSTAMSTHIPHIRSYALRGNRLQRTKESVIYGLYSRRRRQQ